MNNRLKGRMRYSGVAGSIGHSAIGKLAGVVSAISVFGLVAATRLFALHDRIVEAPDLFDLDGELLAGPEEDPQRSAIAGRRTGGDHVARAQREFLGEIGDLLCNGEMHIGGGGV